MKRAPLSFFHRYVSLACAFAIFLSLAISKQAFGEPPSKHLPKLALIYHPQAEKGEELSLPLLTLNSFTLPPLSPSNCSLPDAPFIPTFWSFFKTFSYEHLSLAQPYITHRPPSLLAPKAPSPSSLKSALTPFLEPSLFLGNLPSLKLKTLCKAPFEIEHPLFNPQAQDGCDVSDLTSSRTPLERKIIKWDRKNKFWGELIQKIFKKWEGSFFYPKQPTLTLRPKKEAISLLFSPPLLSLKVLPSSLIITSFLSEKPLPLLPAIDLFAKLSSLFSPIYLVKPPPFRANQRAELKALNTYFPKIEPSYPPLLDSSFFAVTLTSKEKIFVPYSKVTFNCVKINLPLTLSLPDQRKIITSFCVESSLVKKLPLPTICQERFLVTNRSLFPTLEAMKTSFQCALFFPQIPLLPSSSQLKLNFLSKENWPSLFFSIKPLIPKQDPLKMALSLTPLKSKGSTLLIAKKKPAPPSPFPAFEKGEKKETLRLQTFPSLFSFQDISAPPRLFALAPFAPLLSQSKTAPPKMAAALTPSLLGRENLTSSPHFFSKSQQQFRVAYAPHFEKTQTASPLAKLTLPPFTLPKREPLAFFTLSDQLLSLFKEETSQVKYPLIPSYIRLPRKLFCHLPYLVSPKPTRFTFPRFEKGPTTPFAFSNASNNPIQSWKVAISTPFPKAPPFLVSTPSLASSPYTSPLKVNLSPSCFLQWETLSLKRLFPPFFAKNPYPFSLCSKETLLQTLFYEQMQKSYIAVKKQALLSAEHSAFFEREFFASIANASPSLDCLSISLKTQEKLSLSPEASYIPLATLTHLALAPSPCPFFSSFPLKEEQGLKDPSKELALSKEHLLFLNTASLVSSANTLVSDYHALCLSSALPKTFNPLFSSSNRDKTARWANFKTRATKDYLAKLPSLKELKTFSLSNAFETKFEYTQCKDQEGYLFSLEIKPNKNLSFPSPEKNVIFVVDGSGTIKRGRFQVFKDGVSKALSYLHENDSFNIIIADAKIVPMSPAPLFFDKKSLSLARRFLSTTQYRGFFSKEDPFSLVELARAYFVVGKQNVVILMTDGHPLGTIKAHSKDFEELTQSPYGDFSLFVASAGKNNNLAMLGLVSTFNGGELIYSSTHVAFPRKLAVLVKHIGNSIASNIRIQATSPTAIDVKFYPGSNQFSTLYGDRTYKLYGSVKSLKDFDLLLQGRGSKYWINIKEHIAMRHAKKGGYSLRRKIAGQRAYACYRHYLDREDPLLLAEAESLLKPYAIPCAAR